MLRCCPRRRAMTREEAPDEPVMFKLLTVAVPVTAKIRVHLVPSIDTISLI